MVNKRKETTKKMTSQELNDKIWELKCEAERLKYKEYQAKGDEVAKIWDIRGLEQSIKELKKEIKEIKETMSNEK